MLSLVLHVSLSFLIEFIVRRAMYTILDMKSVPTYLALCLACFVTSYTMQRLGFNPALRALIISPLTNFVVPFVMSRGPAGLRLTRIAFIDVGVLLTEIGGSVLYFAMNGRPFPGSFSEMDPMTIVVIYTMLALLTTITCEANIAFFRRADSRWDRAFEPSALALMVSSFAFFSMLIIRYDLSKVSSFWVPLVTAVCAFFAVVINYAMVYAARQDARAKGELARQTARNRQIKHLMHEAERMTERSVHMRHLRHDLANQVGIVHTLAEQGRVDEADRYLAALQTQAQAIASLPDPPSEANHE